ncbi:hypothetical protein CHS0354_000470 [Potamilus streckersoni]|uniref:Glycine cleavage system H protein, mitochondrial n=1 Tax=Potamilus streckersoni TaxID=2493646 RepID=A0AAE0T7V5_9BIVA|nr:hypothetical protein CHS0354_000470 [Potamilus streckersoni]
MNIPNNLYYTKEHEWVKSLDNKSLAVGITDFAQFELGDIVYVDLKPVGTKLKSGETFGTVEAVKTVSDLFMPIDGEIIECNPKLTVDAALVNSSPYDEGWMIKALIMFLRNEVYRVGYKQVVVGLSGGIDSAVTTSLCVRAFGAENVLAVLMPYSSSSQESIDHATLLANTLKLPSEIKSVTSFANSFFNDSTNLTNIRRGNVLARCRMIVLYDISSRDKRLVIGTSNKTELLLGYGTLFGDMASAINPIGDIYKSDIFKFAHWLNIPSPIIEKKPSADLWEGQTDEADFGFSYSECDEILFNLVDLRMSDEEILSNININPATYFKIKSLIQKNQFKRMMPIIPKLSNRTIGIDFLYARDWNT